MTVNWIHPVIFKEEHYTNISVAEKQCCNDYGKLKDVVLWSEAQQTTCVNALTVFRHVLLQK